MIKRDRGSLRDIYGIATPANYLCISEILQRIQFNKSGISNWRRDSRKDTQGALLRLMLQNWWGDITSRWPKVVDLPQQLLQVAASPYDSATTGDFRASLGCSDLQEAKKINEWHNVWLTAISQRNRQVLAKMSGQLRLYTSACCREAVGLPT